MIHQKKKKKKKKIFLYSIVADLLINRIINEQSGCQTLMGLFELQPVSLKDCLTSYQVEVSAALIL